MDDDTLDLHAPAPAPECAVLVMPEQIVYHQAPAPEPAPEPAIIVHRTLAGMVHYLVSHGYTLDPVSGIFHR